VPYDRRSVGQHRVSRIDVVYRHRDAHAKFNVDIDTNSDQHANQYHGAHAEFNVFVDHSSHHFNADVDCACDNDSVADRMLP